MPLPPPKYTRSHFSGTSVRAAPAVGSDTATCPNVCGSSRSRLRKTSRGWCSLRASSSASLAAFAPPPPSPADTTATTAATTTLASSPELSPLIFIGTRSGPFGRIRLGSGISKASVRAFLSTENHCRPMARPGMRLAASSSGRRSVATT